MQFPRIKQLWLRAWIVVSLTWAVAVTWIGLARPIPAASLESVESVLQPSVVALRRSCTRYNYSVEVRMSDGSHVLCFRSVGERDTYFKWFAKASEKYVHDMNQARFLGQAKAGLSGPLILALLLLAADWVLRGAGRGFLFSAHTSEDQPEVGASLMPINLAKFQAALPLLAVVVALWACLPLIAPWTTVKKGLDAFGPESAGPYLLSGVIVLLYRKTTHALVTIGSLLIFLPPAALLLYPLLKANGLNFLLAPFGIACIEFARYLGSSLQGPSQRYARFGWQLLIFIASYFLASLIFSIAVYS